MSDPTSTPFPPNLPGIRPESLEYIITQVLLQPSDGPLARALDRAHVYSFVGLISLPESDIADLDYEVARTDNDDGSTTVVPLDRHLQALVVAVQGYCDHRDYVEGNRVTMQTCMTIDPVEFHNYRSSSSFLTWNNKIEATPVVQKSKHSSTPAEEFARKAKLDPSAFPTLSQDKQWDRFNRELEANCRSYGLSNILDRS
ncbi:MAG: hypothetical protein VX057_04140, partial [Candidatus Thermoplasmatota archaeon]|nr:hypothetical protein [Candidatus Thermoplasmatota archaeon]